MHGTSRQQKIAAATALTGAETATPPAPKPSRAALAERGRVPGALAVPVSISIRPRACDFPFWPRINAASPGRRFAFQCADALDAWCDSIGAAQRVEPLFVAVTTPDGAPLLLLPLGITRRHGLRVLGFLDGTVSDFNAPVVFAPADQWDAATLRQVWQRVLRELPGYDVAILRKMPETIDGVDNPLRHLATSLSAQGAHAITLPADKAAAQSLLPNLRDSRRRLRKLGGLGEVAFPIADNLDDALAFTRAAMAMKGRWLVDTIGIDRFASEPGYADYYIETTRRLFATGAVHVSALTLDGAPLAAHWGFVFGGRFYFLLTAFAEGEIARSCATGRLHKEFLIEWAATAGLDSFDLGVGDEAYKTAYSNCYRQLYDAILPRTLPGAAYGRLVDLRRQLARRVRASALAPLAERIRRDLNRWRQPR